MHDPSTVAFEIRHPWLKYSRAKALGERSGFMSGYRAPFITIWHEDPLDFKGKCGCRGDDSCGWFRPPFSKEQGERIIKLGRLHFSMIWGKLHAVQQQRDYARVCYEPSVYDAIYWTWRAINHSEKKQGVWQYRRERNALTAAELEEIYMLASNPVDNLRLSMAEVHDEETCADFFMTVFRCWQRHNRPWYRHPRWHVWHWRIQLHPWQTFRRWAFSRCCKCGKGFAWGYSPMSGSWDHVRPKWFCSEVGSYHHDCNNPADTGGPVMAEPKNA